MNILNMIPIVGWILSAVFCFFLAIPTYFLWNGLVPTYFSFLPPVWLSLPFWHVVGLLWLVSILRGVLLPSVVSSSSTEKKD